MKILLTGASGFVGSHILDSLLGSSLPVVLLLRSQSGTRLISPHLEAVETRRADFANPASLKSALADVTHVIHCAGAVKARSREEFFEANQHATRRLVDAFNQASDPQRFLLVSSLAAAGPSRPSAPAREGDPERPASVYGESKLAGEREVAKNCRAAHVIVRPPAVYGPRDQEFLRLFRAIKRHVRPIPANQPLSFVYVEDLARVVPWLALNPGRSTVYYAAAPEPTSAREFAKAISRLVGTWTIPLPLPTGLLWPVCLAQELLTRVTGKANVLSLQKYRELRAPGWVCDPARLAEDHGVTCPTSLEAGLAKTLAWYRENRWL